MDLTSFQKKASRSFRGTRRTFRRAPRGPFDEALSISRVLSSATMTSPSPALEKLSRGAVDLIDSEHLARKLARGPVTVKVGFDPSAPDIHLGHTVLLRKMRHCQDAGHRVVFVIGDFTAMIG